MMKSILTLTVSILILTYTIPATALGTTLQIPAIDLNTTVVNAPLSNELGTWDVSYLWQTVGHLEYLPPFGDGGNVVLAGHSIGVNGLPDVFYSLDNIQIGDEITVTDNGTVYQYTVSEIRIVDYTDVSILLQTADDTLTLFTCDISSETDEGFFSQRYVVIAKRNH